MSRTPSLILDALKPKANATPEAATPSRTEAATPITLLRIVASTEVGDLVADLGDAELNKRYAAFVARTVAIRDGNAP